MSTENTETACENETRSGTESTSCAEMVPSKPWPDVVLLGQQILEELGQAETNKTLTRWMAHRVAELLAREEEAATDEEREEARRACADLVLRLWHQRREWPDRAPFAKILAALKGILPKSEYERWRGDKMPKTWLEVLPALDDLMDEEWDVCRQAALMEIDPSTLMEETTRAEKYGDALDDDEEDLIALLNAFKQRRDELDDLSRLTRDELVKHFGDRLKSVQQRRAELFTKVCSVAAPDDEVNDNGPDA